MDVLVNVSSCVCWHVYIQSGIYVCIQLMYACMRAALPIYLCRLEPGYNDIGLNDTSFIPSDILRYQLIPNR